MSFKLQYRGNSKAEIFVKDASAIAFSGTLKPGDIFSVEATDPARGRFSGSKIDLFVNDVVNSSIPVICPNNVLVNNIFGNFVIVEARSRDGIRVCCETNTVGDAIGPQFTLVPDNIAVELDGPACSAPVQWAVPQYDDCNKRNNNGLTSTHVPGSNFSPGVTTVVYTAIDLGNNITKYSFTVTVTDKAKPVFTICPEDTIVKSKTPSGLPVEWETPVALDNCSVQSITSTIASGEMFDLGEETVTYTATDPYGNTGNCSFLISVVPDEIDIDVERMITPDDNGINDAWIIANIEEYPDNQIIIFDRWGNEVFNAQGYDNERVSWKGDYPDSKKAPTGTYFYSITVKLDSKKLEQRGFIELIR